MLAANEGTSTMTKLSDMQRVLLSGASQREDGSVLPLPTLLASAGGRSDKSIVGLLTRGLIEERETSVADAVRRSDGDLRYGLFITSAGLSAIGVASGDADSEDEEGDAAAGQGAFTPPTEQVCAPPTKAPTKAAIVLALLQREQGASLADLIAATGWLPHTTRAALTGLRKKGHAVERTKGDDGTTYRVAVAR